jgi:general secretion pathway protein K
VIAALQETGQGKPADPFDRPAAASSGPLATTDNSAPAQKNTPTAKSSCYRVIATIRLSNGRRTTSEVVISLGDKIQPYHILSWQDDVERRDDMQRRKGA